MQTILTVTVEYIQKLLEQEKTELPPEEKTEAPATDRHNFRITDDAIGIGGAKEKFRNNMVAINLLHELEIENRLATPEEQEVLSRYVGWGGFSMAFNEHNAAWAEEFKELYASRGLPRRSRKRERKSNAVRLCRRCST